jgi:two-component system, NarL family, sensor kinase
MRLASHLYILALLALPTPSKATPPPDSLWQAFAAARIGTERLDILLELGAYYGMRGHDSTLIVSARARELAQALEVPQAEVRSLLIQGLWQHNRGRYATAKQLYFEALAIAEHMGLTAERPHIFNNLAITYQRTYQQDSSYLFRLRSIAAFEAIGSPYEIWKAYYGLFEFFADQADLEQARAYAQRAYATVEGDGSRMDRGYLLFQFRQHFFALGAFEDYAYFQEQWEQYQLEKKTELELMERPEHVALLVSEQSDPAQTAALFRRAITYFEATDNTYRAGHSAEDLGNYYLSRAELTPAAAAFQAALQKYEACGASYRRGRVLQQLYRLNKKQGRAAEALGYLEAYKVLADSLAGLEVAKNLDQLKIAYETAQTEQALRLSTLELREKTQQRNLLLGGLALLLILGGGIFWSLRERLRHNRRLAQQEALLQEQRLLQLQQAHRLENIKAMIEGEEKERLRIANDLHDSLGGLLTSAKAQLSPMRAPSDSPQRAAELLDQAAAELRRISHGLMPRALSLLGLPGALEDLAAQIRENGLDCQLQLIGQSASLPATQAAMLFRIAQELVNNALKHAQARRILLQLIQHEGELCLIVEDDGRGFELEQARQLNTLGLGSLDSRVKYLHGDMDIDTAPGRGTEVTVRIPWPR